MEAEAILHEAMVLLNEESTKKLSFTRLDDMVRIMHLLGQKDKASGYKEQLKAAGFVPIRPYP
jgi:hypothetical protein